MGPEAATAAVAHAAACGGAKAPKGVAGPPAVAKAATAAAAAPDDAGNGGGEVIIMRGVSIARVEAGDGTVLTGGAPMMPPGGAVARSGDGKVLSGVTVPEPGTEVAPRLAAVDAGDCAVAGDMGGAGGAISSRRRSVRGVGTYIASAGGVRGRKMGV